MKGQKVQTVPVKYTDRIHGFQGRFAEVVSKAELKVRLSRNTRIENDDWHLRCALVKLTRRHHECKCESRNITTHFRRTRYIQGESWGEMQTFYEVDMHLLTCRDCGATWYESLPFLPHPMSRITKSFAKLMIRIRESMSITDIARKLGVDWRCVKDTEKEHLAQKYRDNSLKGVTAITIDEMYLYPARALGQEVCDDCQKCGDGTSPQCHQNIHRAEGELRAAKWLQQCKGVVALKQFTWRLKKHNGKIRYVYIDMSQAYSKWVEDTLPKAKIVFDHFHLIKAMIEKMDHVHRREMSKLDYEAKSALKELCLAARESKIYNMIQMANMVENHLEGIRGYWDFGHANSGSAEGFNTRIRLLMKQSYGLHDFKYLKLKILDLPSRKIKVNI